MTQSLVEQVSQVSYGLLAMAKIASAIWDPQGGSCGPRSALCTAWGVPGNGGKAYRRPPGQGLATWASPNHFQISCTTLGCSCHSPGGSVWFDRKSSVHRVWQMHCSQGSRRQARDLAPPWWFALNTAEVFPLSLFTFHLNFCLIIHLLFASDR